MFSARDNNTTQSHTIHFSQSASGILSAPCVPNQITGKKKKNKEVGL